MPDGFPNSGRREIRPRRAGRDRADPGAAMRGREWISVRRCSLDYMEVPLRKRGGMAVNPQGSKTGWAHKFLGSFAGGLVAVITVTGIIGGSARVALIEIKGQTSVVGVGDRIGALVVRAISGSEVVLGQSDRTIRLPVARAITASAAQPTAGGGPAAAAPVTKAPPAAAALEPPAAAPAGTPANGSPTAATQPAATSTVPQPPTTTFRSVTLGPTGYPQPTSVPVRGVPLSLSTGPSPVLPLGATVYTPSGTSDYGFASAPITTQNTVTPQGATTLPVAASEPAPAAPVLPPGATLNPPPQSTVGRGLAMVTSLATDLPIKVELGP